MLSSFAVVSASVPPEVREAPPSSSASPALSPAALPAPGETRCIRRRGPRPAPQRWARSAERAPLHAVVLEPDVPCGWLRKNRRGLWYSVNDIPFERLLRLIDFFYFGN